MKLQHVLNIAPNHLKQLLTGCFAENYNEPKGWLFPNRSTKERLSRATPQLVFKKAKKKAGIKKNVTFHSLRHSFSSHLLEAGVDIRTIQILLGHSSITSTAKYLHVARKNLGSARSPLDLLYVPDTKKF